MWFPVVIRQDIILTLGILNFILMLILFSTCRCAPNFRIPMLVGKYGWYKFLMKKHCYVWWILWPSIIVHLTVGMSIVYGWW